MKKSSLCSVIQSNDFQNNIWTLLSSGITACYSLVLILVVTRASGVEAAGVVSFALAIVALFTSIMTLAARIIQSVDTHKEFSLQSYLGLRVITISIASISLIIFLLISSFEELTVFTIVLVFMTYLSVGVADVFMGNLQREGKMRIAGKMQVCSFSLSILSFAVTFWIFSSIERAFIVSFIFITISYVAWIWSYRRSFGPIRAKYEIKVIFRLAKKVLPYFLSVFMFGYLYNMQKYYLGILSGDSDVGVLSLLLLPGTFLNLLSNAFFTGAEMTKTAKIFNSGLLRETAARMRKQAIMSVGLGFIFIIGVYLVGTQLLSWITDSNLQPYRYELVVVAFGGAMFAPFAVVSALVIVMNIQKYYFYCLICVTAVAAPTMWFVVSQYGLRGAAYTGLVIMLPLTIVLFIICHIKLKRLIKRI